MRYILSLVIVALAATLGAADTSQPRGGKAVASDPAARRALASAGATLVADYGSFAVFEVPASNKLRALPGVVDRDDFDVIHLRRGDVNTRYAKAAAPVREGDDLYVVQFVGPSKDEWLGAAREVGLEVLAPVPSCGVLVRGTSHELASFSGRRFVQWASRLERLDRLDPDLDLQLNGGGPVAAAVQVVDDPEGRRVTEILTQTSRRNPAPISRVGGFLVVRGEWSQSQVSSMLEQSEIVNVERLLDPVALDERVGMISASELDATGTRPLGPGYLGWLLSKGFTGERFDFGIDFLDSGLDWGAPNDSRNHPDFRDSAGVSRVSHAMVYVRDNLPADQTGHGTLNSSVAVGYNVSADPKLNDESGFSYGMGVAPWSLVGSSKILDDGGRPFAITKTLSEICQFAYSKGSRICSNSWGMGGNKYTIESAEFDEIVRDVDPVIAGNQEYSAIFAAGNAYGGFLEGTIHTPGTSKNVITVGATEGYRPIGVVDGCDVGDDGADNAGDIIDFSSGGPTKDGRAKPDIVAPGTHIQGAASQFNVFTAYALCVAEGKYFPAGQKMYAWASGTSQSAPAVAGGAALVRQYGIIKNWLPESRPPSPALIKATLLGSASPVSGEHAGPTLPDRRQGYGRMSFAPIFDDAARTLVDQTVTFGAAGAVHEVTGEVGDPGRQFRVALVWTDAAGVPTFAPQVNDLDLEVRIGDVVFKGNRFSGFESSPNPESGPDTLNNVEIVTVPAGLRGEFTVTVRAAAIAGDGVPGNADSTDQDFALVVYNVNDGRWPYEQPPLVTSVQQKGHGATFKLLIAGERVTSSTQLELNGVVIPAEKLRWLEPKLKFKIFGPAKSLGVVKGENQIVAVNGVLRSPPVAFTY